MKFFTCKMLPAKNDLSNCYFELEKLSTKIVDNPVEAVDMFQNCHM